MEVLNDGLERSSTIYSLRSFSFLSKMTRVSAEQLGRPARQSLRPSLTLPVGSGRKKGAKLAGCFVFVFEKINLSLFSPATWSFTYDPRFAISFWVLNLFWFFKDSNSLFFGAVFKMVSTQFRVFCNAVFRLWCY